MTLATLLSLLLIITLVCLVARNRYLDSIGLIISGLLCAAFIIDRPLTFPDDEQYERIYEDVTDSFVDSPGKYGPAFKILLYFTNFIDGGDQDIRSAFVVVFLILTALLLVSNAKNKTAIFYCIVTSMTVAMFVQMRQALSIAFITAALIFRGQGLKTIFLGMGILSHISVAPFAAIYALNSMIKGGNSRLLRTLTLGVLLLVAVAAVLLLRSSSFLFGIHPDIALLVSEKAVEEGNVGIGGLVVFAALAGLVSLIKDKGSQKNYFIYSVAGACIYVVSMQLPLFQRMVLPFYCYYIVHILDRRNAIGFSTTLLFGLLTAFSIYKAMAL